MRYSTGGLVQVAATVASSLRMCRGGCHCREATVARIFGKNRTEETGQSANHDTTDIVFVTCLGGDIS